MANIRMEQENPFSKLLNTINQFQEITKYINLGQDMVTKSYDSSDSLYDSLIDKPQEVSSEIPVEAPSKIPVEAPSKIPVDKGDKYIPMMQDGKKVDLAGKKMWEMTDKEQEYLSRWYGMNQRRVHPWHIAPKPLPEFKALDIDKYLIPDYSKHSMNANNIPITDALDWGMKQRNKNLLKQLVEKMIYSKGVV